MRKVLFLVLGFLFVVFLTGCSLPGQKPKQSGLNVVSDPRSTVFLDEKHVGQTPFYDEKLKPGEYVVKLMPDMEATAASPWVTKIKLNPETLTVIKREFGKTEEDSSGEILSLEFLGKKKQPELAVLVKPDGASIRVDGDLKGTAPLVVSNIKEGDHEIEISIADYYSRRVKVRVEVGYRLTVNVDLAKKSEGKEKTATPTRKIIPTLKPTIVKEETATEAGTKKFAVGAKIVITETETGWLRVRLEPSLSGSEAAKVNPGQEFSVLDEKSGWIKIEYEGGKEGWVSGTYVKLK